MRTALTALLAAVLAVVTGFSLVSANSEEPKSVDSPLVTYGSR